MKKKILIYLFFLNLIIPFNTISYAKTFSIGVEVNDVFNFNSYLKIKLDRGNWEVIRANTRNNGVLQRIVGIVRVENNEIMEMIEVYEGLLAGFYIGDVDPIIIEIVF